MKTSRITILFGLKLRAFLVAKVLPSITCLLSLLVHHIQDLTLTLAMCGKEKGVSLQPQLPWQNKKAARKKRHASSSARPTTPVTYAQDAREHGENKDTGIKQTQTDATRVHVCVTLTTQTRMGPEKKGASLEN